MSKQFTSMERVLKTMSMAEPDRVPLFLMGTHFCAKLLELPIKTYFSKPETVAKGQLTLMKMFQNDCVNPYYSAAHEISAFGMEVIYLEDGPPNAGEPVIKKIDDILKLEVPNISDSPTLRNALETIALLKQAVGNSVPIGGGVLSPFTMPILQLGFNRYIELIYERPDLLEHLIQINEQFCVTWANAQLKAGATFITSIDSMAVGSIVPKSIFIEHALPSARRTLAQINSAVALATSSASSASITEEMISAGIKAFLVSHADDLEVVKAQVGGRATLLGNLNGIEMCRWTRTVASEQVRLAIEKAGRDGGFIVSDSLGDLPYQVDIDILHEISESVRQWGAYPL